MLVRGVITVAPSFWARATCTCMFDTLMYAIQAPSWGSISVYVPRPGTGVSLVFPSEELGVKALRARRVGRVQLEVRERIGRVRSSCGNALCAGAPDSIVSVECAS